METITDIATVPRITRSRDARELALAAYDALFELLASLAADDWDATTECAPWTVADMVGHMIGAARSNASIRESLRQQVTGMRRRRDFDGNALDAVNDLQVREHAGLSPEARVSVLRELVPAAVAGRMRMPGAIRRLSVPLDQGGSVPEGIPARLNLGHLVDVVYTRDVWLHRIDIARATGRAIDTGKDLDRRVVADVVAEWATRHGAAVELDLTGPAGGRFRHGTGGGVLTLDAIEFCRILSGREAATGLLATRVVF